MLSRNIKSELGSLSTPFYLYDMGLLRRTLEAVSGESKRYGYKVHYAVKANFDRRIVSEIRKWGLGIDCVSGGELALVRELGFPADSVVYAGVGKSDEEIRYAIREGICAFNCESRQELQVIDSLAAELGLRARVALRVNPDVDPHTHRHISTGHADSKFGISYKEIDCILPELASYSNIDVVGLHFHVGSQICDMRIFEFFCKRVNTLLEWFREHGLSDISYLNMGGGLGIDYDNPDARPMPDFGSYFATFDKFLNVPQGAEVHFELGRAIVGQCCELVSRVLFDKVNAAGNSVAVVDASMAELIRPALYGAFHAIENLDARDGDVVVPYTVAGTVCESSDIFAEGRELPRLCRGDMVSIKSAGAYGMSMASRYNLHTPAQVVYYE